MAFTDESFCAAVNVAIENESFKKIAIAMSKCWGFQKF